MQLSAKKYLYDILVSIESIFDYIEENRDFKDYQQNKMLRRAVEREIEIIGEAMNSLVKSYPEMDIPHARKIIDTRNFVIHGYDKVDDAVLWGIIINHLPKLEEEVKELLEAE
jgi:uncharacterized protein with HEPN domain